VPSAFYHFAFEAGSEAALEEKRNELIARGVDVTEVVDHDWAKSIYFKDPNGLQLEFCCFTRNLNDDDARMQDRFQMSVRRLGLRHAGPHPHLAHRGARHRGARAPRLRASVPEGDGLASPRLL
jgi:catechol-2,3-dioxygenase